MGASVTPTMTFDDRIATHRSGAAVALAHQRWSEAEQELRALLAIAPNDATAWNNLGVALEHQQKNKEAVEAYARAAALAPNSRPASSATSGSPPHSRSSRSSTSAFTSSRCRMMSGRSSP